MFESFKRKRYTLEVGGDGTDKSASFLLAAKVAAAASRAGVHYGRSRIENIGDENTPAALSFKLRPNQAARFVAAAKEALKSVEPKPAVAKMRTLEAKPSDISLI